MKWIALALSFGCTAMCWWRIAKTRDVLWFRVLCYLVAAVPFVGPPLFLVLDLPPVLPEDAQVKPGKGTGLPSGIKGLVAGNKKHIDIWHGLRSPRRAGLPDAPSVANHLSWRTRVFLLLGFALIALGPFGISALSEAFR